MTKFVGVHEAKTHLSRLLDEVVAGGEVEIMRRGVVVARLVRAPAASRVNFGFDRGQIRVGDDFDDPLAEFDRVAEGGTSPVAP
jgi:prevent-host-death family protein